MYFFGVCVTSFIYLFIYIILFICIFIFSSICVFLIITYAIDLIHLYNFIYSFLQLVLFLNVFIHLFVYFKLFIYVNDFLYIWGAFNKFPDFFVQAFKIVEDSWKFTILLLYILWYDWPIFMILDSNEQLQQQLEDTILKPDCHSWWISKMHSGREDTLEERYAIKFCFKLGKNTILHDPNISFWVA